MITWEPALLMGIVISLTTIFSFFYTASRRIRTSGSSPIRPPAAPRPVIPRPWTPLPDEARIELMRREQEEGIRYATCPFCIEGWIGHEPHRMSCGHCHGSGRYDTRSFQPPPPPEPIEQRATRSLNL